MTQAARAIWAIVPVKRFGAAKSRLASLLDEEARVALARAMCEHVLAELRRCRALAGVLVATDGEDAAELARAAGAAVVADATRGLGGAPLGRIVDAALAEVAARSGDGAVVVMADLPRLDAAEIDALCAHLADADLVIAPDLRDEGTNALALAPPSLIPTCFGNRDSFARHLEAARRVGLRAAVLRRPGLAFDVDTAEDLGRYRAEDLSPAGVARSSRRG